MREGIHPKNQKVTVTCVSCGATFETGSTKGEIRVDTCSKCHPFYTNNLKVEKTGGRAEKFKKKFGIQ